MISENVAARALGSPLRGMVSWHVTLSLTFALFHHGGKHAFVLLLILGIELVHTLADNLLEDLV